MLIQIPRRGRGEMNVGGDFMKFWLTVWNFK